MKKLIRTSTIALSLDLLLNGQLEFLGRHYEVVAVSGDDQHLQNVRVREKVRTYGICMQRQISPLQDIRSLFRLYRFFMREKPLIVHSITPKAGLLSMIAARLAGVPIRMHTFTGLIFPTKTGILKNVLIMMDRLLCSMATNVYPEGDGVRKDLLRYKITSKDLKVIGHGNINGVNTEFYDPNQFANSQKLITRAKFGIAEKDFVFIFVGRLVADKGIDELVTAFTRLLDTRGNSVLLLVGPLERDQSPIKKSTEQTISDHPRIISAGFQQDVRQFYAIADALVFPSYREGFPNVVLQAGAMGLPAIVTNISGSNEIIENDKNGLIIPVRDESALFDAMIAMIDDTAGYQRMASMARANVEKRFEQKFVWSSWLAEYERLEKLQLGNV